MDELKKLLIIEDALKGSVKTMEMASEIFAQKLLNDAKGYSLEENKEALLEIQHEIEVKKLVQ